MHIEYHRWFSPHLNREMELKVYGHYGKPVVVFPVQAGRFYDFEGFGMVDAVQGLVEGGKVKLFTVDSVDSESWCNGNAHPADRARRHEDYDAYIVRELAPFVRHHCGGYPRMLATGCSMGAYHSANLFFRHPDVFEGTISLSGLYQLRMFVGDYVDERVYLNSPLLYLPNLHDPWYLDQYRRSFIVVCVGQGAWEDAMLADTRALERILKEKDVPAWFDYWGFDVDHDWPWWRRQLPYFLSHVPGIAP